MKWKEIKEDIQFQLFGDDEDVTIVDKLLWMIITILLIVSVALMFTGCKSSEKIVTVEKISHDTLYKYQSIVDTTVVKDSIFLSMLNDTIVQKEFHTIYKYKLKCDTIYKSKTDSVPKIVKVEKQLGKADTFRLKWFDKIAALLILIVGGACWAIWIKIKS